MKFGLFTHIPWPEEADPRRIFEETTEQVVAKIQDIHGQGVECFGCNFAFGGMEHGKVMRSMELFAKEVTPHFA